MRDKLTRIFGQRRSAQFALAVVLEAAWVAGLTWLLLHLFGVW